MSWFAERIEGLDWALDDELVEKGQAGNPFVGAVVSTEFQPIEIEIEDGEIEILSDTSTHQELELSDDKAVFVELAEEEVVALPEE